MAIFSRQGPKAQPTGDLRGLSNPVWISSWLGTHCMVAGRLLDLLLGLSDNPADVINALRTLLHGLLGCATAVLELVWEVLLEPRVLLDALHADAVDWVAHKDAAHEVQAFPRQMQVAGKAVLDAHDTLQVQTSASAEQQTGLEKERNRVFLFRMIFLFHENGY